MLKRLKSHHPGSIVVAAILVVAAFVGASLAGAADEGGGVSSSAANCGPGGGPSQPIGPSGPTPFPCEPANVAVVAGTTWMLRHGQQGGLLTPFTYGTRPLTPIMGDWNCDTVNTAGTFERGTFRLNDQNDDSIPEHTFVFGDPRGFAVAADFDGNCYDDVAVYRNGTWQVHYLGPGAPADDTFTLPAPFGQGNWPNTVPVAGDWNGDAVGGAGIGTYDLATATWVLKDEVGAGAPDYGPFVFGTPGGSYPVVGDWNGDGFDTPGYRSLTGTTWTVRRSFITGGQTDSFDFGPANSLPLTW